MMYFSLANSHSYTMSQISYGVLGHLTEELATKLRHLGVKRNIIIGILMDHSLEYVLSCLALLRAGCSLM
jgi:acyl-CoA synthetase (AMP-forming)/AMP-acid ligase II